VKPNRQKMPASQHSVFPEHHGLDVFITAPVSKYKCIAVRKVATGTHMGSHRAAIDRYLLHTGPPSSKPAAAIQTRKVNNLKHSKTKLPWFSCFSQHSAFPAAGHRLVTEAHVCDCEHLADYGDAESQNCFPICCYLKARRSRLEPATRRLGCRESDTLTITPACHARLLGGRAAQIRFIVDLAVQ